MKRVIVFVLAAFLLASCDGATPTSHPTPTAKPKLKILDMAYKRNVIGQFVITGVAKNAGQTPLQFVKVSCRGYTANKDLVDTDWTYTDPHDLGPGDDAIFTCRLDETKPISNYECKAFVD